MGTQAAASCATSLTQQAAAVRVVMLLASGLSTELMPHEKGVTVVPLDDGAAVLAHVASCVNKQRNKHRQRQ